MGRKKIWFILSGTLILISILALVFWSLNLGLDFAGGVIIEIQTEKSVDISTVRNIAQSKSLDVIISSAGDKKIFIRAKDLKTDQKDTLEKELSNKFGKVEEVSFQSVGPTISKDLIRKSFLAILLASLFIIFYVAYAFRKVSKQISSWRFGICAILALVHDAIIVIGLFAILGHFLKVEVDSLFVTAILTVIGFSVHDTIVIYDRIRENLKKNYGGNLDKIANQSITEMLPRDIATSFVIILVLLALYFLGGESTKYFALAIAVGMVFGTYSSIFVASTLAVAWQKWSDRRKTTIKAEAKS
jgi:preprotein translocase subunit SecF